MGVKCSYLQSGLNFGPEPCLIPIENGVVHLQTTWDLIPWVTFSAEGAKANDLLCEVHQWVIHGYPQTHNLSFLGRGTRSPICSSLFGSVSDND